MWLYNVDVTNATDEAVEVISLAILSREINDVGLKIRILRALSKVIFTYVIIILLHACSKNFRIKKKKSLIKE